MFVLCQLRMRLVGEKKQECKREKWDGGGAFFSPWLWAHFVLSARDKTSLPLIWRKKSYKNKRVEFSCSLLRQLFKLKLYYFWRKLLYIIVDTNLCWVLMLRGVFFLPRHCDAKVDLLSFFIFPKKVGIKMGGGQPCNSTFDPQNAQSFF